MMFLVLFMFALLHVDALPNVFEYEIEKANQFVRQFEESNSPIGKQRLSSFEWKDCSTSAPMVNIKSLSISPDPLSFPGPLIVSTDILVKQNLTQPIKAQLVIKKKILGTFIEIPCIDNFGSCSYDDLCTILSQIGSQCPDPLKKIGLKCSCPIANNEYKLSKTEFDLTADVIPSGDYQIQAHLTKGGAEVLCVQITVSIE